MTFTHDFDVLFSICSNQEDFNTVPVCEIRSRILETIDQMSDLELLERVCLAQSFPNEDDD